MEETPPSSPPARKKIRLTRAEAYALQLANPRRRRMKWGLTGLLVFLALGGGLLWHFRDSWLSSWLPGESAAADTTQESAPDAENAVGGRANHSGDAAPAAAPLASELDFLSAVVWDHPRFLHGVRLFNQTLDRQRRLAKDPQDGELARQIEDGALEAATVFDEIRSEAPPAVPLADYIARCQQLVSETRRLVRPAQPAPPVVPPAAASARPDIPPFRPGEPWQHPDYLAGAKLFNQALEQYQLFLEDKSRMELLKPIEDLAFQAAKKFEALKSAAPEGVPLGDHITQCYKLISDCRRQHLEGVPAGPAKPFDRGTTGPSRRPALPPYQPPP